MVLQRGSKGASIWGHSTVHGDKVQLYVNKVHSGSATVDSHGIWQGKVTDPGTNKAVVITASSSVGNVTLHDVLFGDVWLCSGQSNMEFNVNGVNWKIVLFLLWSIWIRLWFEIRDMVFNATVHNISAILWRSVLLMEETGVPGENHRPVTSHWQNYCIMLYTLPWSRFELTKSAVLLHR